MPSLIARKVFRFVVLVAYIALQGVGIPARLKRALPAVKQVVVGPVLTNNEVRWRVVQSVAIDVVNDRVIRQLFPKDMLGNFNVCKPPFAINARTKISIPINMPCRLTDYSQRVPVDFQALVMAIAQSLS